MTEQIYNYFSFEMMYIWLNFCVLPFWFVLLFFPQSKICKIFVTSIFPILIFTIVDIYLIFEVYKSGFNLFDNFKLYLGLNELIYLFNETNYVVLFWIHFLAINLFCGCWIVRDYMKINMPKFLAFFPLVLTYFIGPVGLFVYWLFRIFFSKKFSLYD